jgi:hypothetical protein
VARRLGFEAGADAKAAGETQRAGDRLGVGPQPRASFRYGAELGYV